MTMLIEIESQQLFILLCECFSGGFRNPFWRWRCSCSGVNASECRCSGHTSLRRWEWTFKSTSSVCDKRRQQKPGQGCANTEMAQHSGRIISKYWSMRTGDLQPMSSCTKSLFIWHNGCRYFIFYSFIKYQMGKETERFKPCICTRFFFFFLYDHNTFHLKSFFNGYITPFLHLVYSHLKFGFSLDMCPDHSKWAYVCYPGYPGYGDTCTYPSPAFDRVPR